VRRAERRAGPLRRRQGETGHHGAGEQDGRRASDPRRLHRRTATGRGPARDGRLRHGLPGESHAPDRPPRFKIGSVTKIFTGALVHRAIEQGKLAYDTTRDHFFSAFPNGGAITIRNLLEHTSGIYDMLNLPAVDDNMSKAWPPDELIAMVAKQPPQFKPGAQQAYSNTGFLMLAIISEQVFGQGYAELVQGMFVEGLGMRTLMPGDDQSIVPGLSCGYTNAAGGGLRPEVAGGRGLLPRHAAAIR
jgi:CubicO group peptidase (beta-lactamase class C family)